MASESEQTSCEPAVNVAGGVFNHGTAVPGIAARTAHARLRTCLQSCPEVRVRAVTDRHRRRSSATPTPTVRRRVIAWNRRKFVFLNATSTIERSQS